VATEAPTQEVPAAPDPTGITPPQPPGDDAEGGDGKKPRRRRLRRPRFRRPSYEDAGLSKPRLRRPHLPLPLALAFGLVAIAAVAIALVALGVFGETGGGGAPGPQVSGGPANPPAAEAAASQLGFPAFATKNTTRIGGSDPASDAAGVALVTYPSAGSSAPPEGVTLVSEDDWQGGIAASVLMADPIRAPVLISSPDGTPATTSDALAALDPKGGPDTGGKAIFAIGDVALPGDAETAQVSGPDPATEAVKISHLRDKLLGGPPQHIVIAAEDDPAFAMPAAAWAARSGDPVLFAGKDSLPNATAVELQRRKDTPVYVLGPPSVISDKVLAKISSFGGQVRRVFGADPVTNAIQFARYVDGSFGWNINDPGHGFVVARSDRPLDAAAAAALSGSGTWGPLLLTDDAATLPGALRGYFLDVKPGYRSDPTRAFYNHVWIIGDQDAIDVNQQATIDDEAELARIGPAPGGAGQGKANSGGGKP
jgi:hypothetical protein